MDLMTLAAKLELDDSSYRKGVTGAEAMGKQLAGKMSAMTVAVGNLAADMVRKGVAAINSVITGAIDGYADYQQLIGGVETLFKGSADKVAKYAQQSFKTTGLSSNQYMETVTSFSASLLQGLKGDTETAADLANMAVTDMADNANKLGTDISSIQAAYQGFAKQNYTMLDNLKLGYGGTAKEMVRLINESNILEDEIEDLDGITFDQIIAAIHAVQNEMGITGTTSKEAASTIQGSAASMQAAWSDMLSVIGGEGDESELKKATDKFEAAFATYMDNLMPTIQTTLERSPKLIAAVAGAIANIPTEAVSQLMSGGIGVITSTVKGASDIAQWLIDSMVGFFKDMQVDNSQIVDLGNAIGSFLGTAISSIVVNAGDILAGLLSIGAGLAEGIISGLRDGLFGDNSELGKIKQEMEDEIMDANVDQNRTNAILDYMQGLIDKYGTAAKETREWKKAQEELESYMGNKASQVFLSYGSNVQGAIDKLRELSAEMRKTAILDAMRKRQAAQYELLGEKEIAMAESDYRRGVAQAEVDRVPQTVLNNLKTYAAEILRLDRENGGMLPDDEAQRDIVEKGEYLGKALEDMDLNELAETAASMADTLEGMYDALGMEEGETIWGKDREDQIFSSDELDGIVKDVEAAARRVQEEIETQEGLQKEIDAINEQIVVTDQALERTAQAIVERAAEASSGISDEGKSIGEALASVAAQIASIRIPALSFLGFMPQATGIDDVPYNGFRASLHRGEMVLTKREAENYRSGGGTAEVVGAIQEMRGDLQNLRLVVGSKTFGRAVVDYGGRRTRDYIGQAESATYAGYGT